MRNYECWKCKDVFYSYEGKISKSLNFTCYTCLKKWHLEMRPIWKNELLQEKIALKNKTFKQMEMFESIEIISNVFEKWE